MVFKIEINLHFFLWCFCVSDNHFKYRLIGWPIFVWRDGHVRWSDQSICNCLLTCAPERRPRACQAIFAFQGCRTIRLLSGIGKHKTGKQVQSRKIKGSFSVKSFLSLNFWRHHKAIFTTRVHCTLCSTLASKSLSGNDHSKGIDEIRKYVE